MDRFGSDLQKIYEANAKRFSRKTVLQLSLRIVCELHASCFQSRRASRVGARSSAGRRRALH